MGTQQAVVRATFSSCRLTTWSLTGRCTKRYLLVVDYQHHQHHLHHHYHHYHCHHLSSVLIAVIIVVATVTNIFFFFVFVVTVAVAVIGTNMHSTRNMPMRRAVGCPSVHEMISRE